MLDTSEYPEETPACYRSNRDQGGHCELQSATDSLFRETTGMRHIRWLQRRAALCT